MNANFKDLIKMYATTKSGKNRLFEILITILTCGKGIPYGELLNYLQK